MFRSNIYWKSSRTKSVSTGKHRTKSVSTGKVHVPNQYPLEKFSTKSVSTGKVHIPKKYPLEKFTYQISIHWKSSRTIGRSRGCHRCMSPPRVQILSFWHTNFTKCSCLGSWRPPYEVGAPPYGKSWIHHCVRNQSPLEKYTYQIEFRKRPGGRVTRLVLFTFFKKNFEVTSHHFVEPLVLSVSDFGWLRPWVLKPRWMHHHLYSMSPAQNDSLESTLEPWTSRMWSERAIHSATRHFFHLVTFCNFNVFCPMQQTHSYKC